MKYQSKFSALLVLFALVFCGCRKDISLPEQNLDRIFGRWSWVESYCGWSGKSTPESTDQVHYFEFRKNGVFIETVTNKTRSRGVFQLSEEQRADQTDFYIKLNYHNTFGVTKHSSYLLVNFSGSDTLSLGGNIDDGCAVTYARIK